MKNVVPYFVENTMHYRFSRCFLWRLSHFSRLLDLAPSVRFAIAAVGIAASILSGILYFHNAKEQWQKYQALAQSLRSEKETYLYCAGAYLSIEAQKEKDSLFVATCEAIISRIEQ